MDNPVAVPIKESPSQDLFRPKIEGPDNIIVDNIQTSSDPLSEYFNITGIMSDDPVINSRLESLRNSIFEYYGEETAPDAIIDFIKELENVLGIEPNEHGVSRLRRVEELAISKARQQKESRTMEKVAEDIQMMLSLKGE